MSVTLSEDMEQEAILVSPSVITTSDNCLSFYIYFNISSADVSIGITDKVGNNYVTQGLLSYPFPTTLYNLGENLCLFKIRLMIPKGSYHVMFIAKGKAGSIAVWNVVQKAEECANSRKAASILHIYLIYYVIVNCIEYFVVFKTDASILFSWFLIEMSKQLLQLALDNLCRMGRHWQNYTQAQ